MNRMIKSGLIMARVMGAVTLNAQWCDLCKTDHQGACPVWEKYLVAARTHDFSTYPEIGHTPNGTPVYGKIPIIGGYCTKLGLTVKRIRHKWLYVATCDDSLFIGDEGEFYNRVGSPIRLERVGTLANGRPVYVPSKQLRDHCVYFRYCSPQDPQDLERRTNFLGVFNVGVIHRHLVYMTKNAICACAMDYGKKVAFFDGEKWIDIETSEVYRSLEEIPQKYKWCP
ncbi:MAG: hypothetical protein LBE99_03035 [Puniceicoccales bacterium]|nr:hypothetical protein [Puniceicoccales bacterium]